MNDSSCRAMRRLAQFLWVAGGLLSTVLSNEAPPRGLDPTVEGRYRGEWFACIDGSAVLPRSAVNDDYCDCVDGSDEPGTAACGTGEFYCHNRGFHAKRIPSYFVDDGVCDCCDGSDEAEEKCENKCFELGEELRKELKQKRSDYEMALKEKETRLQKGNSITDQWKQELEKCLEEIDQQNALCNKMQQDVESLEAKEKKKQEEEKNAAGAEMNVTVEVMQSQPDMKADGAREEAEGEAETTATVQEEETEMVLEADYGQRHHGEAESDDYEGEDADYEERVEDDGDGDDEAEEEEEADATEQESEETEMPTPSLFTSLKEWFTSFFTSSKAEEKTESRETKEKAPPPPESDLQKLRREHVKEKKELKNKEDQRDALKAKIDRDYGPDSKFISLADKCFELKQDKYTYEICLFDRASQKEKHHNVVLGKFRSFGELYEWMDFDRGQRCANGKHRSLKVHFHCGKEDAIQSVQEPNICEYAANFSTPVVCTEAELEKLQEEMSRIGLPAEVFVKDEL